MAITLTPSSLRSAARSGTFTSPTAGQCPGHVQANVLILPAEYAGDFRLLCARNPVPCPVLGESTAPGHVGFPEYVGEGVDITTDVPGYNVYEDGVLVKKDVVDVREFWTPGSVAFLIGCSFTFEDALIAAGLTPRHVEAGSNVPMYRTNQRLLPAGVFGGTMVVSMRPYAAGMVERVREVTRPYVRTHGEPVAWGWEALKLLGIADVHCPEFGDPPEIRQGDMPVFWGCGVTAQMAVMESPSVQGVVLGHAPGKMLCMDLKVEDLLEQL